MKRMDNCTSLVDLITFAEFENNTAVIHDNGEMKKYLTYKQLQHLTDQVSRELSLYTTKPCVVGICMEAQLLSPALLIGILKTGSAFYNFDSEGLQFVQHVLLSVGCKLILTDGVHLKLLQSLIAELNSDVKSIKLLEESFYLISLRSVASQSQTTKLAYVITTSGTTGIPKIVKVPHACITPNIVHIREIYNLKSDDIVMLCSPLTFDPSIVEIFTTLSVGAKLLIVPTVVKMMPDRLLDIVCLQNKVTVMQATPTIISRFGPVKLKSSLLGDNSSLRVLSLGGEKFPDVSVLNSYRSTNNRTVLINLYGITEVSAWATYYVLTEDDLRLETSIPLGLCLQDTVIEVRDESGHKIIEGTGELFIGGYKRQCMIMAFDHDDLYDDSVLKLCPTGDIVRLDKDGNLFYVGRKDNQLKRHGKRINLEEITEVTLKHEAVCCSTTVLMDTKIVTFVTLSHRHRSENITEKIKTYIAEYLPSYSIPDDIVVVENLPMTKHGKVNQQQLREMYDIMNQTDKTIVYSTELLKQLWKAKLNIKENIIQEDSNLIQLGGNSLTALHLLNDVEKCLRVQLPYLLDKLLAQTLKDCDEYIHNVCSGSNSINSEHQIITNKRKMSVNSDNNQTDEVVQLHASLNFRYAITRGNQYRRCKLSSKEEISTKNCIHKNSDHKQKKLKTKSSMANKSVFIDGFGSMYNKTYEFGNKCISDNVNKFNFNTKGTSYASVTKTVIQLEEDWRFNTGKCVDASPLIVLNGDKGTTIFIGSHSHMFYSIDLTSGECIWETTLCDRVEASACLSLCGNFVIVGCYDGYIYSLDCAKGSVWWKYQTGSQVKCCPVVDRDTGLVYAGSHSQSVYCFNIMRKEVVWSNNLTSGSIFASPAVCYDRGTVMVATLGGKVFSLNKVDGTVQWCFDCNKPVFSSLICTQSGVLVGCTDTCLYHLDFGGNLLWKFSTTGPIFSSPSIFQHNTRDTVTKVEPYIFIGSHDCMLYCISIQGSLIWKTRVAEQVYSTPFCCDLKVGDKNAEFVLESDIQDDCNGVIAVCGDKQTLSDTNNISEDNRSVKEKSISLARNNVKISADSKTIHEITQPSKNDFSTNIENPIKEHTNIHVSKSTETPFECLTMKSIDESHTLQIISKPDSSIDYTAESQTLPNNVIPVVVFCTTNGALYILDGRDGHILCDKNLPGEVFSSPICYKDSIIIGCRNDFVYNFKLRIKCL